MRRKFVLAVVGVVVVAAVVRILFAQMRPSGDVAVDTTGASAGQGTNAPGTTPVPAGLTATAGAQPLVPTPTAGVPTTTPVVVEVQGSTITVDHKPLVLLNPSTVRQGSTVGVAGSGFDPGSAVDLYLLQHATDKATPLTFVQVDRGGSFGGVNLSVPETIPRGNFVVMARQRNSDRVAQATGVIAGNSPQVKLGIQAGKAGDAIDLTATGFEPNEIISVCWNVLCANPISTLRSDAGGNVIAGTVRVPFGAVGNNALVFVGSKSQSPVTVPFTMLNLYPTVKLSTYAIKSDNVLTMSGTGFGPHEKVSVYFNSPNQQPITTIQTSRDGSFVGQGGFIVPFHLSGRQTIILVGEQSKAPATASFDILPYTPNAQPSTYGGRPGTVVTFYGMGF